MDNFFNLDIVCKIEGDRLIENITVDSSVTIRQLKRVLLERFRDLKEKFCFINYGFILHQSYEACGHFIADNTLISSLNPADFNGLNSGLMFMYKQSFRNIYQTGKMVNSRKSFLTLRRMTAKKKEDENKLIQAITNNNILAISEILRKGLDPNFNDKNYEMPPTFHAISCKVQLQENILDLLTNYGAHVDFKSSNGLTIMHHAVILGNYSTITTLSKYGPSLDDVDTNGNPAWFLAINCNMPLEFFRWVLLTDPSYGATNDDTLSAFHLCCRNNLPTHLEVLLDTVCNKNCMRDFDRLVNIQNKSGNTALHYGVIYRSFDCVKILKNYKASLVLKNYAGETPIAIAQRLQDFNVVSLLQLGGGDALAPVVNNSSLVAYVPPPRRGGALNEIRQFHHHPSGGTPTALNNDDPHNIGIEFGFSQLNPFNKINTLKFKSRTKSYVRVAHQLYPPVVQAVSSHCPLFHEQLPLAPGDLVQVFISFDTGTAFGRKKLAVGFIYGWFPTTCIGLDNPEAMVKFKKAYFNKENFELLKMLSKTIYYGQIPILKEIVVSDRDFHLGLEMSFKRDNFSNSILDPKNPLLVSPHYIKSIKENSLARDYEFRVGDRILAINDEDVTSYDHPTVSEIIKKVVNSTKKLCVPKQCGSTFSMKWFKKRNDDVAARDKRNIVILVGRYHVPPVASQSPANHRTAMTIRSVYTDTGGQLNGGGGSSTVNRQGHIENSLLNSYDSHNDSLDILESLVDRMGPLSQNNHARRRSMNTSLPPPIPIAFTISPPPSSSCQQSPKKHLKRNSFKNQPLLEDNDDNISIMTPTSSDLFPEIR